MIGNRYRVAVKIAGWGLLLAAVAVVAGLWLWPFGVDNPSFYEQSCTPIVQVLKHQPAGIALEMDLCHRGSVERVQIGVLAGVILALLGIAVLIIARATSGPGTGDEDDC